MEGTGLDYYGILGIDRKATIDDIQRAYRQLALKYHPFRYDGPMDRNYFYEISEAYDVLSNPKIKCLYDQYGEKSLKAGIPVPPQPDEEVGDIQTYTFHGNPYQSFREFFGVDNPYAEFKLPNIDPEYKFRSVPEEVKQKGPTRIIQLPLTLEEAFHGCKKILPIEQTFYNEDERKTYEITESYTLLVPRGCSTGRKFILRNVGDESRHTTRGDLIFVAIIQPHEKYELIGKDFVVKQTIPLAYSLTGCVIDVETIDEKILHVPLTDITKPRHQIVICNEGMTIEGSEERGNLIIEFDIEFPEKLSKKQKQLMKTAFLVLNK